MLSDYEIDNKVLGANNFKLVPNPQTPYCVEALKKIWDCINTDADILTDGEVIDMIDTYLQAIGVNE